MYLQIKAKLLAKLNINCLAVNTHLHADHITGTGVLKKLIPSVKSVISIASGAASDVKVADGAKIAFGKHELEVRSTPGHTNGCVAYVSHAQHCVFHRPPAETPQRGRARGSGGQDALCAKRRGRSARAHRPVR